MAEQPTCSCGKLRYNMVFACSGAADVGAVADQAARALARDKKAAMSCTAAVGAAVPEIMERTLNAAKTLVIDGCDKDCAKAILSNAGVGGLAHLRLTDLGMEKGKTPPSDDTVATAAAKGAELLAD